MTIGSLLLIFFLYLGKELSHLVNSSFLGEFFCEVPQGSALQGFIYTAAKVKANAVSLGINVQISELCVCTFGVIS